MDYGFHHWRYKRYLALVKGKIKKGDRVLDVGCGEGHLLSWLPECEKFGLEIAKGPLRAAKKRNRQARFFPASADEKFPFKDDFFDWVFCTETIEHLKKPKFCLEEVKRVLKKGGYLLISTYNHFNVFNLLTGRAFFKPTTWEVHLEEYNWFSFRRLLKKNFKLEKRTQAGSCRLTDSFFYLTRLPWGEFMIILAKNEKTDRRSGI